MRSSVVVKAGDLVMNDSHKFFLGEYTLQWGEQTINKTKTMYIISARKSH